MALPLLLAIPYYAAIVTGTKVSLFSLGRFIQNGFDPQATLVQLEKDVSIYGKDFSFAIAKLSTSKNLQEIIDGAHALKRVVDTLPAETVAGLNKTLRFDEKIEKILASATYRGGMQLITAKKYAAESNTDYLKRLYFGLFLVGRSGNTLPVKKRTSCVFQLLSLHKQKGTQEDIAFYKILQTFTPAEGTSLANVIKELSEIFDLHMHTTPCMVPIYISIALGGDISPKNQPPLITSLTEHFTETV